ncbi:MAG: hypothetical protein AB8G99_21810 [Planctomycetaceae bacterium]
MSLAVVEVIPSSDPIPDDIEAYLTVARSRAQAFIDENRVPAFVSCDFEPVYAALRSIRMANQAPGNVFCEWGSGFGIVASMANSLGFESYGIEIEGPLVDHARTLADEFDHRVQFVNGSFVPAGCEHIVERAVQSDVFWLNTEADDAYDSLEMEADDFDVIFAYPWPGEDDVITNLFEDCSAHGSLLVTYSYLDGVSVYRKV